MRPSPLPCLPRTHRRSIDVLAFAAMLAVAPAALTSCAEDEPVAPTSTGSTTGAGGTSQGGSTGSGGTGGSGGDSVHVQLVAFNDFHGHLLPEAGDAGKIEMPDGKLVKAGGAAYLAAHVAELRALEPNTLVVSAGDLIGASPLVSALFHDEPTIEAMNLVGLDVTSVGNHEFDRGSAELLRMQYGGCSPVDGCGDGTGFPGASFRFLAANVFVDAANGKTLFPRYDVREVGGAKIAFIGMTLEGTPSIVSPTGISGLTFADEVETVNALVPELEAQGIEAIVVLLHEGGAATGSFDECPGISGPIVDIATDLSSAVDVIVSGHTHQAYNCEIAGKIVTSAASYGRLLTSIQLDISTDTGDVIAKAAQNLVVTRDVADDAVETFVAGYDALAAPLANQTVGTITADLDQSPPPGGVLSSMGAVVADSQLFATQDPALGGAQVAFMNPGGVRGSLPYAKGPSEATDGIVTYGEIFTVEPFGNALVVMTLTGDQIDALLESQFGVDQNGDPAAYVLYVSKGFTYTISAGAPLGSKVDFASIQLDGVPLEHAAAYRVVVNGFMATGGDGFDVFVDGTERVGGAIDVDALGAYLWASAPLSPPALDRISVVP